MLDHRIPPALFCGIQRRVRGLDQVLRLLRVARHGAGDADADGGSFGGGVLVSAAKRVSEG
jgi:hypothetical protein